MTKSFFRLASGLLQLWRLKRGIAADAPALRGKSRVYEGMLFLVFFFIGTLNLFFWDMRSKYPLTGDEPHYLVLAESLARFKSLSPVEAYKFEFETKKIFNSGLAPAGSTPDAQNAHLFEGTDGFYSLHSLGLPFIILPAYILGGETLVRLFLIASSGFGVVLLFRLACRVFSRRSALFWAIVLTFSYPYFYFSSQIYPETLARVLVIVIVYCAVHVLPATAPKDGRSSYLFGMMVSIAVLPWLHNKYAVISCLIGAVVFAIQIKKQNTVKLLIFFTIPSISAIALLGFNQFAYGQVTGPYPYYIEGRGWVSGMAFHAGAINTALGSYFDQSQGVLFLYPLTWVVLCYIRKILTLEPSKSAAVAMLTSTMLVILANGLHENPYLGWSFVGRGSQHASLFICYLVIAALAHLQKENTILYAAACVIAVYLMCFSALAAHYAGFEFYNAIVPPLYKGEHMIAGLDLRNADGSLRVPYMWSWLAVYSFLYFPIGSYLPAFMAPWYREYLPNFLFPMVALILIVSSLLAGARDRIRQTGRSKIHTVLAYVSSPKASTGYVACALIALVLYAPTSYARLEQPKSFAAASLYGNTGHAVRETRIAKVDQDAPGLLVFSPPQRLKRGRYEVTVEHSVPRTDTAGAATLLVVEASSGRTLAEAPIGSTNGARATTALSFESPFLMTSITIFVNWPGIADLEVSWFTLKRKE